MPHSIVAFTHAHREAVALAIVVAGGLIVTLLRKYGPLRRYLMRRVANRSDASLSTFLLDQINGTLAPALYLAVCYAGVASLALDHTERRLADIFGVGIVVFAVTRVIAGFVTYGMNDYSRRRQAALGREQSLRALVPFVQVTFWIIAFVVFLDSTGFHVSTLVAGLGIGTAAIAFAAQQILKDVIGYAAIVTDRPFELGDMITIDTFTAQIEYIGMKTTRLRSLSGEQLIFPNSDLTAARIHNWKRMYERRVPFNFGITYDTPSEKIRQIPAIVKRAVEAVPQTRFNRSQWIAFGDYSLTFEVIYYVLSADYDLYAEIQHQINLGIKEGLEDIGVHFAFPTQTVQIPDSTARRFSELVAHVR